MICYVDMSDQTANFTHETKMLISLCWKCSLAFNELNMMRTDSWIQNFSKKRRNSPKKKIFYSALLWHRRKVGTCARNNLVRWEVETLTGNMFTSGGHSGEHCWSKRRAGLGGCLWHKFGEMFIILVKIHLLPERRPPWHRDSLGSDVQGEGRTRRKSCVCVLHLWCHLPGSINAWKICTVNHSQPLRRVTCTQPLPTRLPNMLSQLLLELWG